MDIRIAILGNVPYWSENLKSRLEDLFPSTKIFSFKSTYSFFEHMKRGTKFDIVIIDGAVDGKLGSELTKQILVMQSDTSVLGFSKNAMHKDSFLDAGARWFLHRTGFSTNQIKNLVQEYIN